MILKQHNKNFKLGKDMVMKEGILSPAFKSFKFSFPLNWECVFGAIILIWTPTFPYLQFNSPVNKFSIVIHLYSVLDCQEGWTVQELPPPWPRWAVSTLIPPGTILIRAEDPTLSSNCSAPSFDFLDKRSPGSQQRPTSITFPLQS